MNKWLGALLTSIALGLIFGSLIVALCAGLAVVAFGYELAARQKAQRHGVISRCWPEVLDSFGSAATAGLSPIETFFDLAELGPSETKTHFSHAAAALDGGVEYDLVLDELKVNFGDAHADRLFELMRLVHRQGGAGYLEALRLLTANCRAELSLLGEVSAKQGWVAGTAKLAICSPWVIVIMLSARPENAIAYNSASGLAVLIIGLFVSLFAYRLIHILGALPQSTRVLK